MCKTEVITNIEKSSLSHIDAIGRTRIVNPKLKKGRTYRDNLPLDNTVFKLNEIEIDWTQKNRNSDDQPANFVIAKVFKAKFDGLGEERSGIIATHRFSRNGRVWKRYSVKQDKNGKEYFTVNFDDDYQPVRILLEIKS